MLEEFSGPIAHILIEGIGKANQDGQYSEKNAALQCQIALENIKLAGFNSVSISFSDALMHVVDAVVIQ